MRKSLLTLMTFVFAVGFYAEAAHAIPAFSRKYQSACTDCHSLFPYLNDFGREFKLSGYSTDPGDYSDDIDLGTDLAIGKVFPIAARIKSKLAIVPRDGDDATNDVELLDAIHEFEVLVAGRIAKQWSGFAELEFESSDGFAEPGFVVGAVTYNYNPQFNVMIARGSPFFADPYSSLSDMRRLTIVKHLKHMDWKSGVSGVVDERLRKPVQQINVHGRVADKVYYMGGFAASRTFDGKTNDKGHHPRNLIGRLVADVIPELSVGAYALYGKEGDAADTSLATFGRFGVTLDGEARGVVYKAAYGAFTEESEAPGSEKITNNLLHASAAYTALDWNNHPFLVPQLIFNFYEMRDAGTEDFYDLTVALHAYVTENVRLTAEFWRELHVTDRLNQHTFQLGADLAF